MKVIYGDTLFVLNALVDYLLLLCSARLAGEPLRRGRFALGAVIGGGYAVALFLPGMEWLYHPLCRLGAAVIMILISFYDSHRLLRQGIVFFVLSCALGGGVLGVSMLGGTAMSLAGGVYYSKVDVKMLLVSAAVCYTVLSVVFRRWGRYSAVSGELLRVTLTFQGRSVSLTALRDTGHTLTDPISGRSVLVAEGEALSHMLGLEREDLKQPDRGVQRLGELWPGRFRLLPYRAVGVDRGLLVVVRMDRVQLGREVLEGALVALSPNSVSDGGNYQVLVSGS